jgi:hypothetical protein
MAKSVEMHSPSNGELRREEVRRQRSEGVNFLEAACLWLLRTWSRMLQGRTGTGCPSYDEEAASSSSLITNHK